MTERSDHRNNKPVASQLLDRGVDVDVGVGGTCADQTVIALTHGYYAPDAKLQMMERTL